ncbi:trypsin-like serine peptidase [Pseudomonas sp. S1_E04]
MRKSPSLFLAVVLMASFAHAESFPIDAKDSTSHAWPNYNFTDKLDKNLIDNYSNTLQGKSLEQLREQTPIVDDIRLQQNKDEVVRVWKNTINTPYDPGPQVIMEYLTRTNLGLPPSQGIVTSPATTKLIKQSDPRITTYSNGFINDLNTSKAYSIKTDPSATQQTISGNNIGSKYQKVDPFRNELSGLSRAIPEQDLLKFRVDSKDCIGLIVSSTGSKRLTRERIYQCFVTLSSPFIKVVPEGGYLDALNLQTSITISRDGTHSCIASFYNKNTWVTAAHCVSEANIIDGRSILSGGKPIPITESMIKICKKPGCDVAFVTASTNIVDISRYELYNPNLLLLTEQSQILIPGIEEGIPIILSDKTPYKLNLMWSDVGKGFCKIYRVQNGCFSHTCSTLSGFSGAPVYWVNAPSGKIELIGIHSGESIDGIKCKKTDSNYAVTADLYNGAIK